MGNKVEPRHIANQYLQEFVERYREAGGEYIGITGEKRRVIREHKIQVFPNPFFNSLKIKGCLKTRIYDISGKFVAEVKDKWNGRDSHGHVVPPGIYFLKANGEVVGKVIKFRR